MQNPHFSLLVTPQYMPAEGAALSLLLIVLVPLVGLFLLIFIVRIPARRRKAREAALQQAKARQFHQALKEKNRGPDARRKAAEEEREV